jgi:hypothetical protein
MDAFVEHRCTNFGMEDRYVPGEGVVTGIMFLSPSKRFPKVFCSNLNYAS